MIVERDKSYRNGDSESPHTRRSLALEYRRILENKKMSRKFRWTRASYGYVCRVVRHLLRLGIVVEEVRRVEGRKVNYLRPVPPLGTGARRVIVAWQPGKKRPRESLESN
jgi:hypothetical protein